MNTPAESRRNDEFREDSWLGLIEVSPTGDACGLDRGTHAFVWVAVVASGAEQFLDRVRLAATQMSLRVESVEDVAAATRSLRVRHNREVRRIAREALSRPTEAVWGPFHAYEAAEPKDDRS